MDQKEKLDYCKYLSQAYRSQFNERCRHESKIVFAALSICIAGLGTTFNNSLDFSSHRIAVWIIFSFVWIFTAFRLLWSHLEGYRDITFAENAEKAMTSILEGKPINNYMILKEERWPSGFFKNKKSWSLIFQILIMAIFMIAVVLVLTLKHKNETTKPGTSSKCDASMQK